MIKYELPRSCKLCCAKIGGAPFVNTSNNNNNNDSSTYIFLYTLKYVNKVYARYKRDLHIPY